MTLWLEDTDCRIHHGDALRCACGCGEAVQSPDAKGRPRRFRRGHNLRVDHPLNRPGIENWWTGRKHSPEARAKIAAKAAGPKPHLRGERNGMFGRTGERSSNWKGGVSPERQRLYASGEWRRVSRQVRVRDGGCVTCHSAVDLHVHHVLSFADHPDLRLDPDNLVTLCRECHIDAHRKGVKP